MKHKYAVLMSIFLTLCLILNLNLPILAQEDEKSNSDISMSDMETLTFSKSVRSGFVSRDVQVRDLLTNYFEMREKVMNGASETEVSSSFENCASSLGIRRQEIARREGRSNLATYHKVYVQDWSTHAILQGEEVLAADSDGMATKLLLNVYEWNWVVYNDGQGGESDEMGFATTHSITVDREGAPQIVSDVYDESLLLGERPDLLEERDSYIDFPMVEQETLLSSNSDTGVGTLTYNPTLYSPSTTNKPGYVNYYVTNAIRYADKYVIHSHIEGGQNIEYYNDDYVNHGMNDCANYVSQCLKAGGMENDYGTGLNSGCADATQWWYLSSVSEKSPVTWRGTVSLSNYWVKKGYSKVTATRPCLKNKSCTNGYDLVNY